MFRLVLPYWFLVLLLAVCVWGAESLQKKPLHQPEKTQVNTDLETDAYFVNWDNLVKTHPTYLYGHLQLAITSWRQGDPEAASKYFHQAQKHNPNHPQVKLLEKLIGN